MRRLSRRERRRLRRAAERPRRTTSIVLQRLERINDRAEDLVREYEELEATTDPETLAKAEAKLNGNRIIAVHREDFWRRWVDLDYDSHMEETGHDRAVEIILRQIVETNNLTTEVGGHPFFGRNLLEMGCGTGTPIKLLSTLLSPEEFDGIEITANDMTEGMIEKARQKLAGMGNVSFTRHDICQDLGFGKRFDTVILSQTLPFIADPELLAAENEQGIEDSEHVQKKLEVLTEVFDRLLKINGHFILIDEWPMKLTESTRDPRKELRRRLSLLDSSPDLRAELLKKREIEEQFPKIFRPIRERYTLYDKIFKRIRGARFVEEVKIRIDRFHSMYGMVYRKDPDKLGRRDLLPSTMTGAKDSEVSLLRANRARDEAVERLLDTLTRIDRHFTEHFRPINGEKEIWADLVPIKEGPVYDSRTGEPIDTGASYGTVILSRQLHVLGQRRRQQLIDDAVQSLKRGGALVVIDEWEAPERSSSPIRKRDWRNEVLLPHRDRLVFQASLREPIMAGYTSGMYCFVYRKRL